MSTRTSRPPLQLRGLRWYICGLLFLVTFINYVDRVSLGALAPLLQSQIGWDDAEFGWINFCFALAYAAIFPVAGRLIDRFGVKAGLAFGVALWSLASLGHALVSSVVGFAAARFLRQRPRRAELEHHPRGHAQFRRRGCCGHRRRPPARPDRRRAGICQSRATAARTLSSPAGQRPE